MWKKYFLVVMFSVTATIAVIDKEIAAAILAVVSILDYMFVVLTEKLEEDHDIAKAIYMTVFHLPLVTVFVVLTQDFFLTKSMYYILYALYAMTFVFNTVTGILLDSEHKTP